MESDKIRDAVRTILESVGEDPNREGLLNTPDRVSRMYAELLSGYTIDAKAMINDALFESEVDEMVIVRNIEFSSLCEHHLLPFTGIAHVGYIPRGRIVGLSKLARLVEGYARRPQVQERLTSEVADALMEALQPDGCGVVIEAVHTCMTIRGIEKPGATMVTSAMRGGFRGRPETRAEFMTIVRGGPR